jgi:hypothetical protein
VKLPSSDALFALERSVARAFETGDESGLSVLGYGEISSVIGLDDGAERFACKRLPPFDSLARYDAYAQVFDDYLAALRGAGVRLVDTALVPVDAGGRGVTAYVVQPRLDGTRIVPRHLAGVSEARAAEIFCAICDTTTRVTEGGRVGIDGQLSNWVMDGEGFRFLDVTTPLLRDELGRERLDTDLFLASLPWALRGIVRRFVLADIVDKYYDARGVALDALGNLHKEGLSRLVPPLVRAVAGRFAKPITEDEVRRYYASDARTWEVLLRVRRIDRAWQRGVRRRVYPFLLPGPIERRR